MQVLVARAQQLDVMVAAQQIELLPHTVVFATGDPVEAVGEKDADGCS
jgi:hypothetical protein